MENTAQASIKLSRSRRRSRRRGVYLPQKMAQFATMEAPHLAWYREQDGIKWHFIVWDVSGYGVRFHPCASREEAMALFAQPVACGLASIRNSSGVYLRPNRQET